MQIGASLVAVVIQNSEVNIDITLYGCVSLHLHIQCSNIVRNDVAILALTFHSGTCVPELPELNER